MRAFGEDWSAASVEGSLSTGPGSLAIALRDNHTEHDEHLDLDFILNVERPEDTTISDCVTGYGPTLQDARRQGIDTWPR
jgi:hypothetical protein